MSFNTIIGNEKIKDNLINTLKNKKISHSYMFVGVNGIGKKKLATEFAKAILCESHTEIGCGRCKSCIKFDSNNNSDFYYIDLEEDENSIKIETIRKMQEKILELPVESNKKVYIINNSDCMTKEAQNCLLKTLEEPPPFVSIILIVSNENRILNTIKSRCLKFYFNNISNDEIFKYVKEKLHFENVTENMLNAAQGSIGKMIEIYNNKDLYEDIENIFSNIEQYNIIDVISKMEILYKNKDNILNILDYINTIFLKKIQLDKKYINYISCIEQTKKKINMNCNFDMCIDKLLFDIFD